jgi:hypothetical protein
MLVQTESQIIIIMLKLKEAKWSISYVKQSF